MAKAADQFRPSDLTLWGLIALGCWSAAVLLANASGFVPAGVFAALHASRLEGATLAQLRTQVADLRLEADGLRRDAAQLVQRLDLAERARQDVTQRVGALEVTVPGLLERVPESVPIDRSVTASIVDGKAVSFDAEGGSVRVEQKPLVVIEPRTAAEDDTPVAPLADGSSVGVAIGFPVPADEAEALWQEMLARVGTLLIGTWPVLTDTADSGRRQIIAGPLRSDSEATRLCSRLDKVGIPCEPAAFAGEALPLLN